MRSWLCLDTYFASGGVTSGSRKSAHSYGIRTVLKMCSKLQISIIALDVAVRWTMDAAGVELLE
jgi:hypothetical protein